MGQEHHIPLPRNARPVASRERQPGELEVVEIYRLNDGLAGAWPARGLGNRFEMRGAEPHEAIAVSCRASANKASGDPSRIVFATSSLTDGKRERRPRST